MYFAQYCSIPFRLYSCFKISKKIAFFINVTGSQYVDTMIQEYYIQNIVFNSAVLLL